MDRLDQPDAIPVGIGGKTVDRDRGGARRVFAVPQAVDDQNGGRPAAGIGPAVAADRLARIGVDDRADADPVAIRRRRGRGKPRQDGGAQPGPAENREPIRQARHRSEPAAETAAVE